MASYDQELLAAADLLLQRSPGARGQLSRAKIRRSISTCYYGLFHFVAEEMARSVVGTSAALLKRRRIVSRLLSHTAIRTSFEKVQGVHIDASVVDYFGGTAATGAIGAPPFARAMARTYTDALAKREDADYNLNEKLSESDARLLLSRARTAIAQWKAADQQADREFKKALLLLMVTKGQLRRER